jgi:hypothetical protein
MSSDNRTPASVLNAPTLTPLQLSQRLGVINGPSRVDRRHVQYKRGGRTYLIPKASRVPAINVPLTRDQSGRHQSKKAKRHAARKPPL